MITNSIIEQFEKIVGKKNASDDPAVRFPHTRDQFVKTRGPDYVVIPENREEIIAILKVCNENGIPVLPKGTGANLAGAAVPERGGVILDLKRMNRILELDPLNMTATVEPGVTFGQLQIEAWKVGLFTPEPSGPHTVRVISNFFGTRGISTYSAKYGIGDRHVLGYEWALPNGEILKLGCFAHPAGEESSNWEHAPGPDLSGLFMEAFGNLGVCLKAKVKLYPKMEDFPGGTNDNYVFLLGPLESCFKAIRFLVKYGVYNNTWIMRWPYIAMLFGRTKEESQSMMKRPAFGAMATIVLEGSEKRINFNLKRLKRLMKEHFKDIQVATMDSVYSPMISIMDKSKRSKVEPIKQDARRMIDFMFLSARAFRVHGAFGGNTPWLSMDDAYNIFLYTEEAAKKFAARPWEIACYSQPVDDMHFGMQEMDLYFNNFDPEDFSMAISAFQGAMVTSFLKNRDSLYYYLYMEHDWMETNGPILFPGYMKLLKKWKTFVDPNNIMNRKKCIDPITTEDDE
ncbi:MAG: FAD-binding oxidoreductase [Candidatus Helarchaeales archaeon]